MDGPTNLGICFLSAETISEAATAYEAALKIKGGPGSLQANARLGLLLGGERDKARQAGLVKLADLDPPGYTFNDVAYTMAEADFQLPLALDYAKKAVLVRKRNRRKLRWRS